MEVECSAMFCSQPSESLQGGAQLTKLVMEKMVEADVLNFLVEDMCKKFIRGSIWIGGMVDSQMNGSAFEFPDRHYCWLLCWG